MHHKTSIIWWHNLWLISHEWQENANRFLQKKWPMHMQLQSHFREIRFWRVILSHQTLYVEWNSKVFYKMDSTKPLKLANRKMLTRLNKTKNTRNIWTYDSLHKKWSFPSRISLKPNLQETADLVTFTG